MKHSFKSNIQSTALLSGVVIACGAAALLERDFVWTMSLLFSSSLLVGLIAVPWIRDKVFGDVDAHWISGELDFDRLDADRQTVHVKSGKTDGLFRIIEVAGMSYDTKEETEQENLLSLRDQMMRTVLKESVQLRFFAVKRQVNVSFEAKWPSLILETVGKREQQLFCSTYHLRWFVIVQSKTMMDLDKATRQIVSTMRDYDARVLVGSQIHAVLNYLVSGELLNPEHFGSEGNISSLLPMTDLAMDYDTGVITTSTPQRQYNRIIAVRAWPGQIGGMLYARILALSADLEIQQTVSPQSDLVAKTKIDGQQRAQVSVGALFTNSELLDEQATIVEMLNAEATVLVQTQTLIVCRATSIAALDHLQQQVIDILNAHRVVYNIDTQLCGHYWFNRLPFKDKLCRYLELCSQNIAALWSFHNSPTGQYGSPWSDRPLRLFKTPVGQNYAFNFHIESVSGALGHYLVIAPSGGGKSTLMAHLLGGLSKCDVPSMIFDSHQGMRWMVECMGGHYQSIGNLALNPLDGEDTYEHRLFLTRFIKTLAVNINDDEMKHLIDMIFTISREQRSLNGVFRMGIKNQNTAFEQLKRWVEDHKGNRGIYADLFNAPRDSLANMLEQSFMTAIDMGEYLADDQIAAPLVTHVTEAIKTASRNSRGFCVFIDEAAALLRNEGFRDYVSVMYREYRKLGGAVGMAFQDPKALFDSGIADAVLDNTATIIMLPNSQGHPDSYQRFGLNGEQIDYILKGSALSEQRTALIIKRDSKGFEESAIINTDLTPYGADILKYYQSGNEPLRKLEALQKQWGTLWRAHI